MKKLFETSKIKELDAYTIEHEPITSIDLVERAANVFVNEFCRRYTSRHTRIYIFAGQGNNGADALAIARLLNEQGYYVFTYLINPTRMLSPECEVNKNRLISEDYKRLIEIEKSFVPPKLEPQDIVIDGIFGSGLNRPLEGGFAKIVEYINRSESKVVSIDIPSGLFGDDNTHNNAQYIIHADLTLTFEFPKLSFLMPENAIHVGEWKELPIGIHPDALQKTITSYGLITDADIASLIKTRFRFANKGDYGHALLIAGSVGKMGAAVLAAKGCLRSGAGLLTVHIPNRGETIVQTALPEAMVTLDKNPNYITELRGLSKNGQDISKYDAIEIEPDISKYDAIGIGPGIGKADATMELLKKLLETAHTKPLVIDADALNLIGENNELLHHLPEGTILTPHVGEFDRLTGSNDNSYERIQKARSIAAEQKICIILKGAYTAVCTPLGKIYFNTSGNPGMATAGSGDVLTGIILGLLSQGYRPEEASVIGVYLHGVAGDLAAASLSEENMIAGDIIQMLGIAFKQMRG